MPNEMQGMFGQDPALVQQALRQQHDQQIAQQAQMDPWSAVAYGAGTGASRLAGGIGGMLGYEDPQVKSANTSKQVQAEAMAEAKAMGIDPAKDMERFGEIVANKYTQYNMPDKAFGVQQLIQNMKAKQADIGFKGAQTQKELALASKALREDDPAVKLVQAGKITPAQYAKYKRGEISMDDLSLVEQGGGGSSQERMIEQLIQTRMPNASEQEKAQARAELHAQILSQPRMGMDPNSGQLYQTAGVKIPQELQVQPPDSGVSGKGLPPVNTLPPTTQGRKPIDISDREKLLEGRSQIALLAPAMEKFKPSYAGYKSKAVADAALEGGRRGIIPSQEEAAQWWESYNQWVTGLMKSTFGASLTENEKKQITTFTASPAQSPKVVSDNIKKQMDVIEKSMMSRANALISSGYNPEETTSILQAKEPVDITGMGYKEATTKIRGSNLPKEEQNRAIAMLIENSSSSIAEKIKALKQLKEQK